MEDVDFSDEFCRFVQVHVPNALRVLAFGILIAAIVDKNLA